jgi:hypothetical protein
MSFSTAPGYRTQLLLRISGIAKASTSARMGATTGATTRAATRAATGRMEEREEGIGTIEVLVGFIIDVSCILIDEEISFKD